MHKRLAIVPVISFLGRKHKESYIYNYIRRKLYPEFMPDSLLQKYIFSMVMAMHGLASCITSSRRILEI
jgi:hypothetical protein